MGKQFEIFDFSEGLIDSVEVADNDGHYTVNLELSKELNVRKVTSGLVVATAKWHYSGSQRKYVMSTEADGEEVDVSGTSWTFDVPKRHPFGWYDEVHQGLMAATGAKVDIKLRRDLWLIVIDPITRFALKPSTPVTRISKKGCTVELKLTQTAQGLDWQLEVAQLGKKIRGVRLELLRGVGFDPSREVLAELDAPGSKAGATQPYAPEQPYMVLARENFNPAFAQQNVPCMQATEGWVLCDPGPPPAEGSPGINIGDAGYRFELVLERSFFKDIRETVPVAPVPLA
jgi:hypothetical protein